MGIVRVVKSEKYFSASNEPFNDKRLRWETRGLIAYLLSKKNNWKVRMSDLEKQGPAGSHKIKTMLKDAQKYGYVNRVRYMLEDGKFQWETQVFESPSLNPNLQTSGGFSTSGFSTSGKLPDIVITDLINTNELEGFSRVIALLETFTGGLNSKTADMVTNWLKNHTVDRIEQAIAIAKANGARSIEYVDAILIGWEANGYPKSREQKKESRKAKPSGKTPLEKLMKKEGLTDGK
jgi:DnaD/phage-associated family protein